MAISIHGYSDPWLFRSMSIPIHVYSDPCLFRSMSIPIHGYHRFFFFVPETLNPIFLGKSKKTRAGKWSRSVFSKVNLEPYDAIWCQFGSQFSSPKTRVYEHNQLIFSILTVFFFEIPGTWKTSQKSSFFDKMAPFGPHGAIWSPPFGPLGPVPINMGSFQVGD